MLKPKIKSVLNQTDAKNREDLEQEIFLMIIGVIKKKEFKECPTFFELMKQEKQINSFHQLLKLPLKVRNGELRPQC